MKNQQAGFRCSECGWTAPKWLGRCSACQAWGSLEDAAPASARAVAGVVPATAALPIGRVAIDSFRARPTGVGELDRVLGGGVVPGSVVLLAGEPGVGKSTLALDVAARAARVPGARPVLYLSGEESASQVRLRAERIGAVVDNLLLAAESDLGRIVGHIEQARPSLVVVDSIQTAAAAGVDGTAGGVSQVRAVAAGLISLAKASATPVVLIGHVTKEGSIAGPRALEHLVDVVCQFEGDRHSRLRMLRAVKNRYGATDEVGCFDLGEAGVIELPDPSGIFLEGVAEVIPGTCVGVTLEGRRPMPVQVQALVTQSALSSPRRAASGLDSARLAMTLAVLQARVSVPLQQQDVYVATVGGARAHEPAMDLPVALAIASAAADQPIAPSTVAFGEVGLTGQVRTVVGLERRLGEAARLGFRHAIVPARGAQDLQAPAGLSVHPAQTLLQAIAAAHVPELAPRLPEPPAEGASEPRRINARSQSGNAQGRSGNPASNMIQDPERRLVAKH